MTAPTDRGRALEWDDEIGGGSSATRPEAEAVDLMTLARQADPDYTPPDYSTPAPAPTEGKAAPRLRLIPVGELLKDRTSPPYLVRGYLPRVGAVWLYSPPGDGKSWIALDLALRVASGLSWGNRPTAQGPVAFLAGEGLGGIRLRVAGWIQAHPGAAPAFHLSSVGGTIDTPEGLGEVFAAIDGLPEAPALVVIDTQSRWQAGDESSTRDGAAYVRAVDGIRDRYACLVLNVHHTTKADATQARGSGTYRGAADCMFRVAKIPKGNATTLVLTCDKVKDWEAPAPLAWNLEKLTLDGWTDEDGEPVETAYLVETEPPREAPAAGRKAVLVPPADIVRIALEYPHASHGELVEIVADRLNTSTRTARRRVAELVGLGVLEEQEGPGKAKTFRVGAGHVPKN